MRIIKLTEGDLAQIVKKVLSEQGSMFGTAGTEIPGYRKDDTRNATRKPVTNTKENINPLNLKLGDGGNKNSKQIPEVNKLQAKLIQLGLLATSTGKPTGFFGELTQKALNRYNDPKYIPGQSSVPTPEKKTGEKPIKGKPVTNKFSDQVRRQLEYMRKNNLSSKDRFTILDDKNNQVHAFNPDYQLYKTYYVITGKNVGDDLKSQTMSDWALENWTTVGKKFFTSWWDRTKNFVKTGTMKDNTAFKDVADYIDNCYFNQEQWRIKNTPSGVFKRAGNIENFMNDWLATTFIATDYGSRFITWETCDGKTIPFGFHGTQNTNRLDVLPGGVDFSKKQCQKRQMSFGCINFADTDVKDISTFIKEGQLTIWLPDASNNIVEIPSNCVSGSAEPTQINRFDQYRTNNKYYSGKI